MILLDDDDLVAHFSKIQLSDGPTEEIQYRDLPCTARSKDHNPAVPARGIHAGARKIFVQGEQYHLVLATVQEDLFVSGAAKALGGGRTGVNATNLQDAQNSDRDVLVDLKMRWR